MASMRDIKRRKASIQSTGQITKAMKLVSTVKLQRSRNKAESSKPYFNLMYDTIAGMLKKSGNMDHKYLRSGDSRKKAVIVITSNRGLAGGYNNNIVKLVSGDPALAVEDVKLYVIGRKGRDGLARRGYEVAKDYSEVINEPLYQDAADLTKELLEAFGRNEIGEIYLAYTSFKNTVVHIPKLVKLLPFTMEEQAGESGENKAQALMNYEPNPEEVLDRIIPNYMSSLIYGALLEAVASENGARMTAMDSATNNAEEMIGKLELQYNRARQGSITQELTEIIAGANAIS
ncbi:MAG: ATP synthase F1 subunit gamma [Lachnospiraceae bacterium]|nr:ATP synthase F1 subunit gamma [Lachnospiraceae bacterium]MCI8960545.1 ATP synthase F1 subunit gamma [Lachnospiraceae bacterium]